MNANNLALFPTPAAAVAKAEPGVCFNNPSVASNTKNLSESIDKDAMLGFDVKNVPLT